MKIATFAAALKARKADQKGFTLIELIIVIAIIGILVAIAIPVYGSIQQNARNNAADAAAANGLTMAVAAAVDDNAATVPATEAAKAGVSGKVVITVTQTPVAPAAPTSITVTATGATGYTLTGTHAKTAQL